MPYIYKFLFPVFLLCLAANNGFAQTDEPINSQDDQDAIERVMQQTDSENGAVNDNTLFEGLEALAKNPIDLNKAEEEDFKILTELQSLNDIQVQSLLTYRKKYGDLITVQELQAVPNWDIETIRRMLPFVRVAGNIDDYNIGIKDLLTKGKNELFVRGGRIVELPVGQTPAPPGSTATRYLGNPWRIYTRYRYTYGSKVSYGFTAEKDAGEQFFKGTNAKGFDFYSGHLYFNKLNNTVRSLAIGDFEARFGQGLILWSGLGYGKGADVTNIKKSARPIKQFSSVNEAAFLRGVGATIGIGKQFQAVVFGSHRFRDANTVVDSTAGNEDTNVQVSALQTIGLHRTPAEIADRDAIQIWTGGASLQYRTPALKVAINGLYNKLSAPLIPTYDVYNQFKFRGTELLNVSADYSYLYQNLNVFGEVARSQNGGFASLNGMILGIDRRFSVSALHRYYSRDYWHLRGNAFGERAGVNNEDGMFLGIQVRPRREWLFNAYLDAYTFPWLLSNTNAPTQGFDYLLQLNHRPSRGTDMYIRFKNEEKPQTFNIGTSPGGELAPYRRMSLRFHVTNKISKQMELRTRADIVRTTSPKGTGEGYLLYQDIAWKAKNYPIQFTARYAIFNTDSYDTRIYSYENDILYSYSVPPYYYKGSRWYLNLRWRPLKFLTAEARVGQTTIDNKEFIGSGLDQLPGNTRTEVRGQLRFSF
jgi:hypothetical protein